jgi:hypothetical protein
MIFAQIMNGQVVNTIVLDSTAKMDYFSNDPVSGVPYDYIIQIDYVYPKPGIGWGFDGTAFYRRLTLALVMNNVVSSVIQNNSTFMATQAASYQAVVDVTTMNPQPMAGWIYNIDGSMSAPPAPGSQAYYQAIVASAIAFGQTIIVGASARNISMGITQVGMTAAVMTYTNSLLTSLITGSLYEAISQLMVMIADTSPAKVGAYATGTDGTLLSGTITFTAVTLGAIGNSIVLTFDGIQQVCSIVGAWNAANPSNQVTYTGSSTAIPESATVNLSGGVNTLAPFVTNSTLYSTLNQIQTYLNIPVTPNPGP